jgi:putative restriction endonuclease
MARRDWTRPELLQVLEFYFRTPFGRLHRTNLEIVELAKRIGRTPSAVALKAVNFASCDEQLKARGIRGMSNSSIADRVLFAAFLANPESHLAELAALTNITAADFKDLEISDDFPTGKDVKVTATSRRGHSFFRRSVYANFDGSCAMTGLRVPTLLTASHIVPWNTDAKLRCDPRNGLLLSALHDRAFDRGLITVSSELRIQISGALTKFIKDEFCASSLLALHESPLKLPKHPKFLPSQDALEYHRTVIFKK